MTDCLLGEIHGNVDWTPLPGSELEMNSANVSRQILNTCFRGFSSALPARDESAAQAVLAKRYW